MPIPFYFSEEPDRPESVFGVDPEIMELVEFPVFFVCVKHGVSIGNLHHYLCRYSQGPFCVFSVEKEADTDKLIEYFSRKGKLPRKFYKKMGAKRLFFRTRSDGYDWVQNGLKMGNINA